MNFWAVVVEIIKAIVLIVEYFLMKKKIDYEKKKKLDETLERELKLFHDAVKKVRDLAAKESYNIDDNVDDDINGYS